MYLDTQVTSALDGNVTLSSRKTISTDLIVWGAGVTANPTVVRRSDLPIEERGRIRARVGSADRHVEGAWAAGDIAAVAARPRVTEAAAGAADSSATATAAQMTI